MLKPIAIATAVAGTLDIVFAMILTIFFGREIGGMLRYVGSGPFPQATEMGAGGAILGLLVHFALIAIMAGGLRYRGAADARFAPTPDPVGRDLRLRDLRRDELAGRAHAVRHAATAEPAIDGDAAIRAHPPRRHPHRPHHRAVFGIADGVMLRRRR